MPSIDANLPCPSLFIFSNGIRNEFFYQKENLSDCQPNVYHVVFVSFFTNVMSNAFSDGCWFCALNLMNHFLQGILDYDND